MLCFTSFYTFYPQNYLDYFLTKDSSICQPLKVFFCEGKVSNFKCYQVLKIFKQSHMDFWNANFLKNIGFFILASFQCIKKISGYFAIAEYVISRHISMCTFRIYMVSYGYKHFLTSYGGLKIILKPLCFFHFQPPRETMLCY